MDNDKINEYVCGFIFSEDLSQLLLIKKNRPAWQLNKLNGVGGHIKEGETIHAAMKREAIEECGIDTVGLLSLAFLEKTIVSHFYMHKLI